MKVSKTYYGSAQGVDIDQYTLENDTGIQLKLITYGGIVTHLFVPDKNGRVEDIVCGFDTLDGYLGEHPYFGAIIGRYGNRIAGGNFSLDGKDYNLPVNNGPNCLHGGIHNFSKKIWNASVVEKEAQVGVVLQRTSPHMEEGFPGNLEVQVTYILTADNRWIIHYEATTDQPTILNLTNHSYFNLAGQGNGSIHDHYLQISSDQFTPLKEHLIPTGEIVSVEGTPFDFRHLRRIGDRIQDHHPMISAAGGYDVNYVFHPSHEQIQSVATLVHSPSGRTLDVATTEPGLQLYTSNSVEGISGKEGKEYGPYCAVCLETQHFPDSPNHLNFPGTVLRPGMVFNSTTVYSFRITP